MASQSFMNIMFERWYNPFLIFILIYVTLHVNNNYVIRESLFDFDFQFMLLTPGSIVFEAYSNDNTAIITRLYAFNLLNEEEVLKGGKPLFEEVGPYIYW